ncbi:MAG: hypothetical protein ACLGH0_12180 [Thermoanaerobaculia bacterium]
MRKPIAIFVLLLAACRGERIEEFKPPAQQPQAAAVVPSKVVVRDAGNAEVFTFAEDANESVMVTYVEGGQTHTLRGDTRESGKRKYTLDGGAVAFEVKPGDDESFKVRTPDGKLRWKVKVTAEKIKVSDNEENANPFELKRRDGGRVKVVAPGERELGNVRSGKVENAAGQTQFTFDGNASTAYGALLLDPVPAPERYIVAAELLSRGQ